MVGGQILDLFPENKSFYYYEGSLPFPPCDESWTWILFEEASNIGKTNYETFKHNITSNVRVIQQLNGRPLYYNTRYVEDDVPKVDKNNDKNTVISLREIGEGKVSLKTLEDSAINKLRKVQSESTELEDLEIEEEDDFDKIYKGEISKSGSAILPSKRARKLSEKVINKLEDGDNESKEEAKPSEDKI